MSVLVPLWLARGTERGLFRCGGGEHGRFHGVTGFHGFPRSDEFGDDDAFRLSVDGRHLFDIERKTEKAAGQRVDTCNSVDNDVGDKHWFCISGLAHALILRGLGFEWPA